MQFYEKFNYLIKLTQISNKELAEAMNVDRSLISLLRNGRRSAPKNSNHIANMALCFAKRCTAPYQRQALAEITGRPSLTSDMPTDERAKHIANWLSGDHNIIDDVFDGLSNSEELPSPSVAPTESLEKTKAQSLIFYGNSGKRQALTHFFNIAKCGDIYMDDSTMLDWVLEDYAFINYAKAEMLAHTNDPQNNFTFTQVLPPLENYGAYSESLSFMLPLYASGKAKLYHYPRMQHSPYNHTLLIAPGQCVVVSSEIAGNSSNSVTIVSTDEKLITASVKQFNDVLSLCRSSLEVHNNISDFPNVVYDLFKTPGLIMQKVSPLSINTLPPDLSLEFAKVCSANPVWKSLFEASAENSQLFEDGLEKYGCIEMCSLATAEQVKEGKVFIGCPYASFDGHPVYTPETYVRHLKNILRLMDAYPNYTFMPITDDKWQGYNLIINENGCALLIDGVNRPGLMLKLRRPEIVQACAEHFLRIAPVKSNNSVRRSMVKMQITALIKELKAMP